MLLLETFFCLSLLCSLGNSVDGRRVAITSTKLARCCRRDQPRTSLHLKSTENTEVAARLVGHPLDWFSELAQANRFKMKTRGYDWEILHYPD